MSISGIYSEHIPGHEATMQTGSTMIHQQKMVSHQEPWTPVTQNVTIFGHLQNKNFQQAQVGFEHPTFGLGMVCDSFTR